VRIKDGSAAQIGNFTDVGALLRSRNWPKLIAGSPAAEFALSEIVNTDWAPVVATPSKIVCVGLNYRNHIKEMGRALPEYPTLFAKYPEALIGPYDDLVLPSIAPEAVDWEGELAVVIGRPARRLDEAAALGAIAGYSIMNDVTMRDFQYRTPEWFQGKTFENSAPFGPWLETEFELGGELRTEVDGALVQSTRTDDLVFSPSALISYVSQIFTLNPGDVIVTGTPGGVGHARKPPKYLHAGSTLTTSVEGIGAITNHVVGEA